MKNKLNFGCGSDFKYDMDNADIQDGADLVFDFNKFPYPILDNTYNYIYSRSVLEHLYEPDKVLNELWRISRNNAIIEIIVAYYNNKSAYSDMQHKHYFSDTTFKVFVRERVRIKKQDRFEIAELNLVPTIVGKFIYPRWLREKLSLFLGGLISYVHIKLRVKK